MTMFKLTISARVALLGLFGALAVVLSAPGAAAAGAEDLTDPAAIVAACLDQQREIFLSGEGPYDATTRELRDALDAAVADGSVKQALKAGKRANKQARKFVGEDLKETKRAAKQARKLLKKLRADRAFFAELDAGTAESIENLAGVRVRLQELIASRVEQAIAEIREGPESPTPTETPERMR
jgi:subtilisin family serine protease